MARDPARDVQEILLRDVVLNALAAIEHERWAHWQAYLHEQCDRQEDGSLRIPADLVERWMRQIETPFGELSEEERESDRDQVRRYLPMVVDALRSAGVRRSPE